MLATPPERLLGAESTCPRTDHELVVRPGDAVVLYTDGLVETGRTGLDEGIDRLARALTDLHDLPLDELCDRLLEQLVPGRADDDIALLVLRARPEDEPEDEPADDAPAG
jgi:serine phosphatase RsbU (regulator of sigma subunit)